MPDRIYFRQDGQQRTFLMRAKNQLDISWDGLAKELQVHPRTLRDWVREKYHLSATAAENITQKTGLTLPTDIKVRTWRNHLLDISSLGGNARYEKYGRIAFNEQYRQQQWRLWWDNIGKYLPSPIQNDPLPIKKPPFSEKLAEFVGIILGDGGITNMQVKVTLHSRNDKAYGRFVKKLINELFDVVPKTYPNPRFLANNIVVSRVELVRYCVKKLGLKMGNKVQQQVNIPAWITKKRSYFIACVRGLVDTDGCVFTHHYNVSGKQYSYKKLSFTSASTPLRLSVYDCFESLGLHPRLARRDVRLDSKACVKKYFEVIGSHNPKHLKRYRHYSTVKFVS